MFYLKQVDGVLPDGIFERRLKGGWRVGGGGEGLGVRITLMHPRF